MRTRSRTVETDALVVGAGLSGLAAAVELARAGLEVLVIEASERVGGRVHTVRDPRSPLPIELGAEFVHGPAPALTALAREAGLVLVDVPASHWQRRDGALAEDPRFARRLEGAMGRSAKVARSKGERSFALALSEAHVREPARSEALMYVEGFQAAEADRISALALAGDDTGQGRIRRVLEGCDALVEHLRRRLPRQCLRLGTRLDSLAWSAGHVRARCTATANKAELELRARRALLTLPLPAWQSQYRSAVRFEPALREKSRAAARLAMGEVLKTVFLFRDAFWEESARDGSDGPPRVVLVHATELPVATWWTQCPLHAPLLTGWSGGSRARELAAIDPTQREERFLDSLARAFGVPRADAARRRIAAFQHDWTRDPWIGGAYSYPLVGGANAARTLAAPVARTLFFAGEATCAPPDNGTLEGALKSGRRAAAQVLAAESQPRAAGGKHRRASARAGRG